MTSALEGWGERRRHGGPVATHPQQPRPLTHKSDALFPFTSLRGRKVLPSATCNDNNNIFQLSRQLSPFFNCQVQFSLNRPLCSKYRGEKFMGLHKCSTRNTCGFLSFFIRFSLNIYNKINYWGIWQKWLISCMIFRWATVVNVLFLQPK